MGISEFGVRSILKRKKETGHHFDRPKTGRKKTGRSKMNIRKVKQLIKKKPTLSVRKLAKQLTLNKDTVWRILKKDLKLNLKYKSSSK